MPKKDRDRLRLMNAADVQGTFNCESLCCTSDLPFYLSAVRSPSTPTQLRSEGKLQGRLHLIMGEKVEGYVPRAVPGRIAVRGAAPASQPVSRSASNGIKHTISCHSSACRTRPRACESTEIAMIRG